MLNELLFLFILAVIIEVISKLFYNKTRSPFKVYFIVSIIYIGIIGGSFYNYFGGSAISISAGIFTSIIGGLVIGGFMFWFDGFKRQKTIPLDKHLSSEVKKSNT